VTSSRDGRVRRSLERAAIPAVATLALWWLGRGPGPVVALVATLAVLALGLLFPGPARRLDQVLQHVALRLGKWVSWLLSALAWTVVVLPAWTLSRLVGYSPLDAGWDSERTAWSAADLGDRRDPQMQPTFSRRAGSPEARIGPPQRRRLSIRRAIIAVPAIALIALAVPVFRPTEQSVGAIDQPNTIDFRPTTQTDGPVEFAGFPVDDYAHEDEPFAIDLFRELNAAGAALRPDRVVGVRNTDIDGQFVNVTDGRRVSYTPDNPTLEVWFFGGSTMYGIGQRDDHTIPSVIARLAEADGINIRATNFGVNGDVNWQETIRFAEALGTDLPRPDLVVFYDGWNEESLGQYRAEIGSLDPAVSERLPFSDLDREREQIILAGRDRLSPGAEQIQTAIPLAAAQYGRGVRTARSLAAADGIEAVHIWQPIATIKQFFPSDDELLRRIEFDPQWRSERVEQYAAIRELSGVEPLDLSTVFDDVERPVYIDQGHTNEMGARLVAETIYDYLRSRLELLDADN